MTELSKESIDRLTAIFMPYMTGRVKQAKESKRRFVHYTTAENALNILRSKRMYLRNTLCMNDYRELTHGLDLLFEFFHSADGKRTFSDAMNSISPNLAEDGIALFDQWLPHNRYEIYVTCISEHLDEEDKIGRLSMWRAYSRSGTVGVAMVLNGEPFHVGSTDLQAFLSPVAYLRSGEFKGQLDRVLQNVRENADFLRSIPRPHLVHCIYTTLLFAAASLKHEGFKEELEWRLIHLPRQIPSSLLEKSVEVISGIPQIVYKIPLIKQGELDATPARLINRLIVGPSNFPYPIYQALVDELGKAGVVSPELKVVTSDIPLRT